MSNPLIEPLDYVTDLWTEVYGGVKDGKLTDEDEDQESNDADAIVAALLVLAAEVRAWRLGT